MEYKVELKKVEDKNYLVFNIDGEELEIDLNSNSQSNLRDLFYKIINKLFVDKVVFKLEKQEGYNESLYIEIAEDYVKKLNNEIENVYNNMPEDLKKL